MISKHEANTILIQKDAQSPNLQNFSKSGKTLDLRLKLLKKRSKCRKQIRSLNNFPLKNKKHTKNGKSFFLTRKKKRRKRQFFTVNSPKKLPPLRRKKRAKSEIPVQFQLFNKRRERDQNEILLEEKIKMLYNSSKILKNSKKNQNPAKKKNSIFDALCKKKTKEFFIRDQISPKPSWEKKNHLKRNMKLFLGYKLGFKKKNKGISSELEDIELMILKGRARSCQFGDGNAISKEDQ